MTLMLPERLAGRFEPAEIAGEGTLRTEVMCRLAEIQPVAAGAAADDRRVDLAFSSETPVPRWFGMEILDHSAGAIDLSWLGSGRAPLLDQHNAGQLIGVVENARLGADRVGRATVRFSTSPAATQILADVRDGIRHNVSIGYQIKEMVLEQQREDADVYRVTSWKPIEVSMVSSPADEAVGVGREGGQFRTLIRNLPTRDDEMTLTNGAGAVAATGERLTPAGLSEADLERIRGEGTAEERARVGGLQQVGRRTGLLDEAFEAMTEGASVADFTARALTLMIERQHAQPRHSAPLPFLDLSPRDRRTYSLFRAIRAAGWGGSTPRYIEEAGFELECSRAIAERLGRQPRGIFIPHHDILRPNELTRAELTTGTGTTEKGGYLVGTDHLGGEFIDLLRATSMVTALGARVMSGLRGNVAIPKQTGGAVGYWLAEGATVTASEPIFDQVLMSPKTYAVKVRWDRRLMLQSDPSVERIVRDDMASRIGLGIDQAAILGAGTGTEPTGIMNTTGVGAVAGGTNGSAITWADVVKLETEVAIDNAAMGALAYLTNYAVRGKLKSTEKASSTAQFIWQGNELNGYRAEVSNQIPHNLTKGSASGVLSAIIFGNWNDLIIGEWGVLDLKLDEITAADSGGLMMRAFQDVDVAIRHAESFATKEDVITT